MGKKVIGSKKVTRLGKRGRSSFVNKVETLTNIKNEESNEMEEEIDIVVRSQTPECDAESLVEMSPYLDEDRKKESESTPEPPRSGEKRRRRVNYFEMHTGKTSPLQGRPPSRINPSPKESETKSEPAQKKSKKIGTA